MEIFVIARGALDGLLGVWFGPGLGGGGDLRGVISRTPDRLLSARDAFVKESSIHWGFVLWLAGLLLLVLVFAQCYKHHKSEKKLKTKQGNPDRLFEAVLKHVDLSKEDRALLAEMAEGARLRHPTMCLLSPGLLEWGRQLWLEEKGVRYLTSEKYKRMGEISDLLFLEQTASHMKIRPRFNQRDDGLRGGGLVLREREEESEKIPALREKAVLVDPVE